jgi:thioredoxin 1
MKLIKIYKNPCVPCNQVSQYLEMVGVKADEEYEYTQRQDMVDKYNVMSVPTLILLDDNGNEVDRTTGVGISKLSALIEKYKN